MTGLMAVFWKELADHLFSKRFLVFLLIMYIAGVATIFVAADTIRQSVSMAEGVNFIFMKLYVLSANDFNFAFPQFLAFFMPILGISLGFDAINSERRSGNLSRILAQPVYRDSVINGKFLAGLATIFILVVSIFLIVGGLGLRMIGVPPTAEEILRIFGFIFITVVYGAFWLALSILFSTLLKGGAMALITSLVVFLFTTFFVAPIATVIADAVVPLPQSPSVEQAIQWQGIFYPISHISPTTLFGDTFQSLLWPDLSNAAVEFALYRGADYASSLMPLPLRESILNVWPQIIALIALSVICFAISYIKFQREEIRST